VIQETDLIRLKREARVKGGFYVEPEAKLLFVMRLRGLNDLHPKTRHILQLLRLKQIHNGGARTLGLARACATGADWADHEAQHTTNALFPEFGQQRNSPPPTCQPAPVHDKATVICRASG
jgi:ribosomal protein L30/L7E